MPFIQIELTNEEDEILKAAAKKQKRSKSMQLLHSALEHARTIVPSETEPETSNEEETAVV